MANIKEGLTKAIDILTLLIERAGFQPEDENNLEGRWYKQWGDARFYTDPIKGMDLEQVFKQVKKYMFKVEGEDEIRAMLYPEKTEVFDKCPKCGYDPKSKDIPREGYHRCDKMPPGEFIELQAKDWHIHHDDKPHSEYHVPLGHKMCPYCGKKLVKGEFD